MTDIQKELQEAFKAESEEHLQVLQAKIGEAKSGKPLDEETIEDIFRRAHSLKGAARAVDFSVIEKTAHHLEALLSRVHQKKLELNDEALDLAQKSIDAIEDLAAFYFKGQEPDADPLIVKELEGFLGLESGDLSPTQKKKPEVKPESEIIEVPNSGVESSFLRVHASAVEELTETSEALFSESKRLTHQFQLSDDILNQFKSIENESLQKIHLIRKFFGKYAQDADANALHTYFNYQQAEYQRIFKRFRNLFAEQRQNIYATQQLCEQLNTNLMKARLVTAGDVFKGFRKMVRDLAADQNKTIEYVEEGLESEVDREVLQVLKDAIMHLLRNSVTHGIESEGEITFSMKTQGNQLHITISDTGKGLDFDAIRTRAQEANLITSEEAASLENQTLASLIFAAGFSTVETANTYAGRGMGMCVLTDALSKLHGEYLMHFENRPGLGIEIRVPIQLSTHQMLLVESQNQRFALPYNIIKRVIHAKPEHIRHLDGKDLIQYDDQTHTVVNLAERLGSEKSDVVTQGDRIPIVLIQVAHQHLAVVVDAISNDFETVVKNVGAPLGDAPFVEGAISEPNGNLVLVIKPSLFESGFSGKPLEIKTCEHNTETKSTTPTILVVDDSVTTRTLEKSMLEANGYKVFVAVDGFDGLQVLRKENIDLLVVDLEMPRLDGFGMIERMKQEKMFQNIPIIIVSSVDDEGKKAHGLKLGASSFILKQKFNNQELLETIGQLL